MAVSKLVAAGFECEFVEKPPKAFQTDCLICLLVLCEPHQVVCCGKSFCRSCIEHIKALNNPCPHCKSKNFNDYPNKGHQQFLYQYEVRCTHQKEGCEWTGELGELDNHLNLDPQPDKQLRGCVFVMLKCIHCSESHQRMTINRHQTEECPKRPFTCKHCNVYRSTFEDVTTKHQQECIKRPFFCEHCKVYKSTFEDVTNRHVKVCPQRPYTCNYCNIYKSTFEDVTTYHQKLCSKRPFTCEHCNIYTSTLEDVTTNHWPVCGYYPVECSNECGEVLQRQYLESHVAEDCPLKIIKCDFQYAGCEVKLPRKKMGEHLRVELVKHTSMMAASKALDQQKLNELMMKQLLMLATENEVKTKQNEQLKKRVTELEKEQEMIRSSSICCTPPIDIVIHNFKKFIKTKDTSYFPLFYTHHRGYKICLGGHKAPAFLSVYVYVMRGEFDDELKWPLKGEVTIQLLSQDGSNEHLTKTIRLDNPDWYSRVTKGERSRCGNGSLMFVAIEECQLRYTNADGNVHIRIASFKPK